MFDASLQPTKIFMRVGSYEGKVYLNLCNKAKADEKKHHRDVPNSKDIVKWKHANNANNIQYI